jgi:hypothetical protein
MPDSDRSTSRPRNVASVRETFCLIISAIFYGNNHDISRLDFRVPMVTFGVARSVGNVQHPFPPAMFALASKLDLHGPSLEPEQFAERISMI